jgi:hypothetical protein
MQQKALLFGTVADLTSSRASENEPIELDRIERRTVHARRRAAGRQRCDWLAVWLSANRDGTQRPLGPELHAGAVLPAMNAGGPQVELLYLAAVDVLGPIAAKGSVANRRERRRLARPRL